jgi:AraC-like DNA-binding protein
MVFGVELANSALESNEFRIRSLVFGGLREMLRAYGLELAPLLTQAQLAPEALNDDFNWVPLASFALILTLAARATGDQCFGLKYGAFGRFADNPLGYLMANAPDLRTALKSYVQYQKVFSTNAASFVEQAGSARIEWSYPVTMTNLTQIIDFALMRFTCRIQAAAGPSWRPLSVNVMHQQPTDMAEYERRLGPRIVFNQPANSVAVGSSTLNLLTPGTDPELFKLVTRFCEQQLEQQKTQEDPLNRIRDAMLRCLQRGSTSPKRVADELGVSPGSLHRSLKSQGTSFQRLFDDTRRRLTHRYLVESSLKLTDIAARVGYSELSAFSRAARRWFGASARTIRQRPPNLDEAA